MGMVKALLQDYCEAMHPCDYDAQDELFSDIVEGRVEVELGEMQRVVNEYRDREKCYGYDDVHKKTFRFVTDYQRGLWINQNPEHRHTVDPSHLLVRRVKSWRLLENGIEEGNRDVSALEELAKNVPPPPPPPGPDFEGPLRPGK